MPKFGNTHKRSRPWCKRALCTHKQIEEKGSLLFASSKLIEFGFWIIMMAICGFVSAVVAIVVVAISPSSQFDKDDPLAPGFIEVALPVFGMAVGLSVVGLTVGFVVRWIGVRRIKGYLIPIRCQRCPKCFYDLSARIRNEDTCPECGIYAPRRECVRLWCKLLRSRI